MRYLNEALHSLLSRILTKDALRYSTRAVEALQQIEEIEKIILFGKVAKGKTTLKSDIDLAIIYDDNQEPTSPEVPQDIKDKIKQALESINVTLGTGPGMIHPTYYHTKTFAMLGDVMAVITPEEFKQNEKVQLAYNVSQGQILFSREEKQ